MLLKDKLVIFEHFQKISPFPACHLWFYSYQKFRYSSAMEKGCAPKSLKTAALNEPWRRFCLKGQPRMTHGSNSFNCRIFLNLRRIVIVYSEGLRILFYPPHFMKQKIQDFASLKMGIFAILTGLFRLGAL